MSQQMEFDETSRQRQEPPFDHYDAGYRDPFMGSYGAQKIPPQSTSYSSGGVSAGQRLALAIVSLVLLVPTSGIVLGILHSDGFFGTASALIGLGLICVTIMVVNIAFALKK
jgi:hypothetical protein